MGKSIILNDHLEFKKTSVKSKWKLQDIERYLNMFINSNKKPLDKFTETDLTKWLNSLDYSIRTINDIKIYLKVFIKWYYSDYSSRFRNLDRICKTQKPPKAYQPEQMLKIEEVEKLIDAEKDPMYKVYWSVFFYGGFRPSECCDLKWDNVFFEDKGVIIKLHTTKTSKDFYKSLPEKTEHLLKQWRKVNTSEYVFPSPSVISDNPTIRARSVCGKLKRLSKNVLGKEVVPYMMRHSLATILYPDDKRKDDDTANQLGHSKSMKHVYMNLDEDAIKTRARKLWGEIKNEIPKEKEDWYKKKISTLEKDMDKFKQEVTKMFDNAVPLLQKQIEVMPQIRKEVKKLEENRQTNLIK